MNSPKLRELRAKVDFALVNVPAFDAASGHTPLPAFDLRLAELTACFTMETFGLTLGEIVFAENHDAALAQGSKDYCLIQKVGHLIHGPPEEVAGAFLDECDACAFLTGHIMERGGYYYLHDQCVLVNRRAWERLGRPAFGMPTEGPQRAAVPRRSAENVHDDYTPVFLDPTGEDRVWRGAFGYGWNAISVNLQAGLRVTNWSAAARAWKRNCYAYYGNPAEWQRALADVTAAPPTADEGLKGIVEFLNASPQRAAAWNADDIGTEFSVDVPNVRIRAGLDYVIVPARTFDVHQILAVAGFHAGTRVIHYDAEDAALTRAENFDDYPADGYVIASAFGTAEAWRAHWQRYRALTHQYVVADLVVDPAAFCAFIPVQGDANVIVSIASRFNDFAVLARFDGARRRMAYDTIVAALKARVRRYLLLGQPPYVRIRGI